MNADQKERRRFKRLLLSFEKRISVAFQPADFSETRFKADILNLSENGLGLRFMVMEAASVCQGEHLYIAEVIGPKLSFLRGVEAEVRWVLAYKPSRGIRAGCEFIKLQEDIKEKIRDFVNQEIELNLDEE